MWEESEHNMLESISICSFKGRQLKEKENIRRWDNPGWNIDVKIILVLV